VAKRMGVPTDFTAIGAICTLAGAVALASKYARTRVTKSGRK